MSLAASLLDSDDEGEAPVAAPAPPVAAPPVPAAPAAPAAPAPPPAAAAPPAAVRAAPQTLSWGDPAHSARMMNVLRAVLAHQPEKVQLVNNVETHTADPTTRVEAARQLVPPEAFTRALQHLQQELAAGRQLPPPAPLSRAQASAAPMDVQKQREQAALAARQQQMRAAVQQVHGAGLGVGAGAGAGMGMGLGAGAGAGVAGGPLLAPQQQAARPAGPNALLAALHRVLMAETASDPVLKNQVQQTWKGSGGDLAAMTRELEKILGKDRLSAAVEQAKQEVSGGAVRAPLAAPMHAQPPMQPMAHAQPLMAAAPAPPSAAQKKKDEDSRRESVNKTVVHAATCTAPQCPVERCGNLKSVFQHVAAGCQKPQGQCPTCSAFEKIHRVHGAMPHQEGVACPVPGCDARRVRRKPAAPQVPPMPEDPMLAQRVGHVRHAMKCTRRDACGALGCSDARALLTHMRDCRARDCPEPLCKHVRVGLVHYEECRKAEVPRCRFCNEVNRVTAQAAAASAPAAAPAPAGGGGGAGGGKKARRASGGGGGGGGRPAKRPRSAPAPAAAQGDDDSADDDELPFEHPEAEIDPGPDKYGMERRAPGRIKDDLQLLTSATVDMEREWAALAGSRGAGGDPAVSEEAYAAAVKGGRAREQWDQRHVRSAAELFSRVHRAAALQGVALCDCSAGTGAGTSGTGEQPCACAAKKGSESRRVVELLSRAVQQFSGDALRGAVRAAEHRSSSAARNAATANSDLVARTRAATAAKRRRLLARQKAEDEEVEARQARVLQTAAAVRQEAVDALAPQKQRKGGGAGASDKAEKQAEARKRAAGERAITAWLDAALAAGRYEAADRLTAKRSMNADQPLERVVPLGADPPVGVITRQDVLFWARRLRNAPATVRSVVAGASAL